MKWKNNNQNGLDHRSATGGERATRGTFSDVKRRAAKKNEGRKLQTIRGI